MAKMVEIDKKIKMIKQFTFRLIFIPVKKDLCSQAYSTHLSIITLVLVIPGASQKIPDLVANSGPFPDHFWHLGHIHIFDDVLQTKAMPK